MSGRVVQCAAVLTAVVALAACAGKESASKSDGTGGQSATGGSAGSASPNGGVAGGGVGSGGAGSGGVNTGGMSLGGDGGGGAGAGRAGSAAGGDVVCPEVPIPLRTVGVRLELETKLELGGQTIEFGEPAPLEGGGTLLPVELRFYLSEPRLVQADGSTVRVDIITVATGEPVPYGVHLVNADDAPSLHFTVLGPPGSYTGVSFTLGINDACNSLSSANPPLSAASAMTWPPPFGFLFLRYAGTVTPGMAAPTDGGTENAPPSAIHMGGLPGSVFATRVVARGNFTLEASGPTNLNLTFDMDELFRAASSSLDVSDFMGPPGPEVQAGERVRRMAPELSLFTLVPP